MADHGEINDPIKDIKPIKEARKSVAVAIKDGSPDNPLPTITAAARGALAEKIAQIAFDNGIKVREDTDLANMLAEMELDSPIPTEALMAVAEILSYVYRANGETDPFNALLDDLDDKTI
jgi:flagellar biosynthesis protein